jgi:hypothetical protein
MYAISRTFFSWLIAVRTIVLAVLPSSLSNDKLRPIYRDAIMIAEERGKEEGGRRGKKNLQCRRHRLWVFLLARAHERAYISDKSV